MAENGVRFLSGQWNAICDVCGQKYKSGEMKKRWDGLMVCPHDWETRHPQDFLRSMPDRQAVPWSRPETPDVFVHVCAYPSSGGLADYGTADCAMASYNIPLGANVDPISVTAGTGPFPPATGVPQGDSQINREPLGNFEING